MIDIQGRDETRGHDGTSKVVMDFWGHDGTSGGLSDFQGRE